VIAAALASGCSAGPPEPSKPPDPQAASNVQKVGGISVSVTCEPAVTPAGGTFALTLAVRNLSGRRISYTLPSGQTYEFLAFERGGGEVWQWSKNMVFIQTVNQVVLEPDQSEVYKVAWNTGSTAPGLYTIQGYFLGLPDVRPAVSVEITK
jgi:hypothetical protein